MKICAGYCVYENSGFLEESVYRVYPLMDKILFSLNTRPWNGDPDNNILAETYNTIINMPDPDKKFIIVSGNFGSEPQQRNHSRKIMFEQGMDWLWTIDDDEHYNRADMARAIEEIKRLADNVVCVCVGQKVYWKERGYCIDKLVQPMPHIVRTDPTLMFHNLARDVLVGSGKTWANFPADLVICHHFSYIRPDDKMYRKITMFTHASEMRPSWYTDVWLKWNLDMENIFPLHDGVAFKKAVPANTVLPILEPLPISLT